MWCNKVALDFNYECNTMVICSKKKDVKTESMYPPRLHRRIPPPRSPHPRSPHAPDLGLAQVDVEGNEVEREAEGDGPLDDGGDVLMRAGEEEDAECDGEGDEDEGESELGEVEAAEAGCGGEGALEHVELRGGCQWCAGIRSSNSPR